MHPIDDHHPVDGYPHSWRRQKSRALLPLLLPLLLLTPPAAMPPNSPPQSPPPHISHHHRHGHGRGIWGARMSHASSTAPPPYMMGIHVIIIIIVVTPLSPPALSRISSEAILRCFRASATHFGYISVFHPSLS